MQKRKGPPSYGSSSGTQNNYAKKYRPPEDDDDDMEGGFEMELANMELDSDRLVGEGPENQQTCVKWVGIPIDSMSSKSLNEKASFRHVQIHRKSIRMSINLCFSKSTLKTMLELR